jgi:hypothetical protein
MINLQLLTDHLGTTYDSADTFLSRKNRGGTTAGMISIEQAEALLNQVAAAAQHPDTRAKAADLIALSRPELRAKLIQLGIMEDSSQKAQAQSQQPTQPATSATFPNISSEHFGMVFLRSATVHMVFAILALAFQAFMYAMLSIDVFKDMGIIITIASAVFWLVMAAALVFEMVGVFFGANFNDRKITIGGDEISLRSIWLTAFFVVQIITDLCVTGVIKSEMISHVIFSLSWPLAIMAYANLFMRENKS